MNKINSELKKIIENISGIPVENISDDENLITDLGFDSLDILEFQMHIKEKFNIEINTNDVESVETISTIIYQKFKKDWYNFEYTFWDIVNLIDWENNSQKPLEELNIKFKELCNNNLYVMEYFNNMRKNLCEILKDTIYDYEVKTYGSRASGKFFKGGDDSFDDLCNHIIGLGEKIYVDCLQHPKIIQLYFDKYIESFAYVMAI